MVTRDDVFVASAAFEAEPTKANAAMLLSKAREAEENGELTDDEFCNVLADIEHWLWTAEPVKEPV